MLEKVDVRGELTLYGDEGTACVLLPTIAGSRWSPRHGIAELIVAEAAAAGEAVLAKIERSVTHNILPEGGNS